MSAASATALARLSQEARAYWEELVTECHRQAKAINQVASRRGLSAGHLVECRSDSDLHLFTSLCPSTTVKMTITYHSWGPVITGLITGREQDDLEFCPEEFEVPIARDLDEAVVAIFDEGRSFSPRDLATYAMQNFRRCFPGLSLPCEELV